MFVVFFETAFNLYHQHVCMCIYNTYSIVCLNWTSCKDDPNQL